MRTLITLFFFCLSLVPLAQDKTKPVVSFRNPAAGAMISGKVVFVLYATDNIAIYHVDLYYGTIKLFADTTEPPDFVIEIDSRRIPDGVRTITAKAYDAAGNIGTASLTLAISNPAAPILRDWRVVKDFPPLANPIETIKEVDTLFYMKTIGYFTSRNGGTMKSLAVPYIIQKLKRDPAGNIAPPPVCPFEYFTPSGTKVDLFWYIIDDGTWSWFTYMADWHILYPELWTKPLETLSGEVRPELEKEALEVREI